MTTDPFRQWWISHFCLRLLQLREDMSVRASTEHARESYIHAGDMDPAEAADMFAERHPPVVAAGWDVPSLVSVRQSAL
jgi:hypothetical protein